MVSLVDIENEYVVEQDYPGTVILANIFIEETPDSATAWLYKGAAERKLKLYQDAIKSFTASLSFDESNWLPWNFRGDSYYEIEEYERAFSDFWHALQIEPGEGAVMDRCARSLYRMGRHKYALELIDDTIKLKENVTPYFIKSHMLKMLGRDDEAAETLNEARRVFPESEQEI
jgi:tetratricopeptide (TPR) repeat protein